MTEGPKPRRKPAERARGEAQKDQRRDCILRAALRLFREREFDSLTMAELASEAGLAKGTVYLYFPTKESLFLGLTLAELEDWFLELSRELARPDSQDEARLIARSLTQRSILRRLLALLHSTLERNVDETTVREFKQSIAALMGPVALLLEQRFPVLHPGEGSSFLLRIYALAIGIGQIANPPPLVVKVLQEPELAFLLVDFEEEFCTSIRHLLAGRLAVARSG